MTEFINERLNVILRDRPILKLARDIMYFIVNSLWKSVSIVSNIADRNVTQHKTNVTPACNPSWKDVEELNWKDVEETFSVSSRIIITFRKRGEKHLKYGRKQLLKFLSKADDCRPAIPLEFWTIKTVFYFHKNKQLAIRAFWLV